MAGGGGVGGGALGVRGKRTWTLLGAPVLLPSARRIDRRVIFGSLVFGVGWGLAGICPGPALVLAGTGSAKGLAFLAAMIAGNAGFEFFEKKKHASPRPPPLRASPPTATPKTPRK